jgi:hypothetical protein
MQQAAVYMIAYEEDHPTADNWTTHLIKWSDGVNTGKKFQGEKWDHIRFTDVDGDDDIDIVASSEEHYRTGSSGKETIIGVVWFENPRITKSDLDSD